MVKTLRVCDFIEKIHWAPNSNQNSKAPKRINTFQVQPYSQFRATLYLF